LNGIAQLFPREFWRSGRTAPESSDFFVAENEKAAREGAAFLVTQIFAELIQKFPAAFQEESANPRPEHQEDAWLRNRRRRATDVHLVRTIRIGGDTISVGEKLTGHPRSGRIE
jgi:hypothetical protein